MYSVGQSHPTVFLIMQVDHVLGLLAEAMFFLSQSTVQMPTHLVSSVVVKAADQTLTDLCL